MSSSAAPGPDTTRATGRDPGSARTQRLLHLLLLRPFMRAVFGAGAAGRRRLGDLDPFIMVANHNSHLDLPLLFQLLPSARIHRTHPLAAYEYFSRSRLLLRTVERLFRPVWLARPGSGGGTVYTVKAAMAAMESYLRAGESVVIFPEGTRGLPGEIARFRRGVGRLSLAFPDVPLVPVLLVGPERALPRTAPLPLPLWTRAVVGEPFWPARSGAGSRSGSDPAAEIAESAERVIREMAAVEEARRHRRYARRAPGATVAVLGIDGSGKSTLARALAGALSAAGRGVGPAVVPSAGPVAVISDELAWYDDGEPHAVRPPVVERLRRGLSRRVKEAKSLKSYKIPKLVELLLRDRVTRHVRRWHRPRAVVMDGCPALNMAAWARMYREDIDDDLCAGALRVLAGSGPPSDSRADVLARAPELRQMVRLHLTPLERPDVIFFLDVPPSVAMERIRSRGEARQVHETAEGLARLREGYLSVCRVAEEALGTPAVVLDGTRSPEALVADAIRQLRTLLPERSEGSDA